MKKGKKQETLHIAKKLWECGKKILGVVFIILGILGLFLPILQGLLLIAIGIALYKNQKIEECIEYWKNKIKKLIARRRLKAGKDIKNIIA